MAGRFTPSSVEGIKDMERTFRQIEPVMKERAGIATDLTRKEVERVAAYKVPVRYGNLRKFITSRFSARTGFATVGVRAGTVVVPSTFGGFGPAGKVVAPGRYAHAVHFGTSQVTGVPFMLDAARSQQAAYATRMREAGRAAEQDLSVMGGRNL